MNIGSLTYKLMLAFLVVSLAGIALVAALVWGINSIAFSRFLTDRGLSDYTKAVTEYYRLKGSWTGVEDYLRSQGLISTTTQDGRNQNGHDFGAFGTGVFSTGQPNGSQAANPNSGPGGNPGNMSPYASFVLVDAQGNVIIPVGPFHQGDTLTIARFQQHNPITVNNQVVGYVLVTGRPPHPDPFEQQYLTRTNESLILAALGAMILAVLAGLFLARYITRPVRELTAAASVLAEGKLNQQVPVRSKDELGQLSMTFNKMSADLQKSNQLRRQMTADIAHDLRTPLAVITGYLEGLKDGVVKPTPKRFAAMYDEATYLQRLVEDLRTLSLADAGELSINRQPVQPADMVERLAAAFQGQAEQNQVTLRTDVEEPLPPVNIDPERMLQAMGNLVSNALRYTPSGGEIVLSADQAGGRVRFEVKDSGSGIDPEVLPHVFDRFYRGDDSRQEGGSGLGLAIAKSIVELQGGKICAASDGPGNGSTFTIQIPC